MRAGGDGATESPASTCQSRISERASAIRLAALPTATTRGGRNRCSDRPPITSALPSRLTLVRSAPPTSIAAIVSLKIWRASGFPSEKEGLVVLRGEALVAIGSAGSRSPDADFIIGNLAAKGKRNGTRHRPSPSIG